MVASKVRLYQPGDLDALRAIVRHKSEQLGMEFWFPPLSRGVTFVTERGGAVLGALTFQPITEMIMLGDQPAVVSSFMQEEVKIRCVLDREGVDNMVSFVPRMLMRENRKSGMEKVIERLKFRRIDSKYAAFEGETYGQR